MFLLNFAENILSLKPPQNCWASPSNTAVFSLWTNPRFERIEWINDSKLHSEREPFTSFLNESSFWMNRVNQWFKAPFIKRAVYFIPEWILVLNESSESMIQSSIQKESRLLHSWMNQPFWTNRVNQWFKAPFRKRAVYFIPEWILVLNESNEWMTQMTHLPPPAGRFSFVFRVSFH